MFDMGKLYETYGFPSILTTEIMQKEHNIVVNEEEFNEYMEQHRKKSQSHDSSNS
jgi:alanyl-tRNA synthetase